VPYLREVIDEELSSVLEIVKRPTPREGGVTAEELAHGRAALAPELEKRGIEMIRCVFRHPANALRSSACSPCQGTRGTRRTGARPHTSRRNGGLEVELDARS
jgi:hypothetical protein